MSEQKEKRNFLSLDLEMNQPSGKIIQIGAVVGDIITGDIVDRIRIYVNPNEPLLEYIVNLCGISQADVDSGDDLVSAYNKLKSFHQKHDCFMNPITWGGGDSDYLLNQLKEEDKDIKWCFGRRWIDVKTIVFSHK